MAGGKASTLKLARQVFADISINITAKGRPYLGAAIGTPSYIADYTGIISIPSLLNHVR